MTSWPERMALDPALRAFVQAQVAQGCVELAALKVEHERAQAVITDLQQQVAELKAAQKQDARLKAKR